MSENDASLCGAWGGCTLPAGHNQGKADIPENHRPVTENDVRALIEQVQENGCNHPTYYRDMKTGGLVARYPGGWCSICEEWLTRLRALSPDKIGD